MINECQAMWICTKKSIALQITIIAVVVFIVLVMNMLDDRPQTFASTAAPVKRNDVSPRNKRRSKEFPSSVADRIKLFVLFIGHTHSSHSIVASVLDSHPHMIVSHESGIVPTLINTPSTATKQYVYDCIWTSSYKSAHGGERSRDGKGYTLVVDKEWQGTYDTYVNIIGDDEAQVIPFSLLHQKEKVLGMLKRLPSLVGIPIKLFHVIRNPYDNIATDVLYRTFKDRHQVLNAKNSNVSVAVSPEVVDASSHHYFRLYEGVEYVEKEYEFDTMTIHIRDFISNPKSVIAKMCEFLGVVCSQDYVKKCDEKIFNKESKTRYKITWTNEQIENIRSFTQRFDSLKRYEDFDS